MKDFKEFDDYEDEYMHPSFEDCIESLYLEDKEWEYYFDEETPFEEEISLYDQTKTFDENFSDGKKVKFALLPIFKDNPTNEEKNFTPLLYAGGKIVLKREELFTHYGENNSFLMIDYHSIFGIRLLSFQRYTDFFLCDERVLFETLIIKFRSFGFKEFYYSYPRIYDELGIKETRAKTIIKRFIDLGITSKRVKQHFVNERASQVSYYKLDLKKIVKLLPKIFDKEHIENVEKDIEKYFQLKIKGAN